MTLVKTMNTLEKEGRSFERVTNVAQLVGDGVEAGEVDTTGLFKLLGLVELVREHHDACHPIVAEEGHSSVS
jgi:hypothetical protein